ncbi:MAG: YIP1 family protein [Planctomycetes bacterium]|nr:YIP1 family protein [Planctomycetota bacterium]
MFLKGADTSANTKSEFVLTDVMVTGSRRTVGLRDIPLVLLAPRKLFAKVEDVTAYGWPLAILLAMVTLIGYATIETGLIDRQVDNGVQAQLAKIEKEHKDIIDRSKLRLMIDDTLKTGEFLKMMTRIQVVVAQPVLMLTSILLISAILYGVVALTGRKPEWHTLMTIGVYAGFVEAIGGLLRLVLMLRYATLEVDTSASLFTRLVDLDTMLGRETATIVACALRGIDPFHVWFWMLAALGLSVTAQLRGWKLWATCCMLWLIGAGLRAGFAFAQVA